MGSVCFKLGFTLWKNIYKYAKDNYKLEIERLINKYGELLKNYKNVILISKDIFLLSRQKRIKLLPTFKKSPKFNQNELHYNQKKIKKFSLDLVIRQIIREIINEMVKDIIITTKKNIKKYKISNLNDVYKVLSKTVKAKELYTDGNSWLEWAYLPN